LYNCRSVINQTLRQIFFMFLKRLEITGFKSFANKTTLDFSIFDDEQKKVLTAIVGPNGSGKSNIADAIRWVMGEHSMKSLRGKKAEDIIFAGSGKKARLGSAQVTLFFDNSSKRIPLDFTEVTITRKIFRNGENEYLINGSTVRLQDVVDILAKAGIGKEGYAVINQGMSDAVLNVTPLERRFVLEDAAGVKQYQIKKERSLRKLDSTAENLKNVRALVAEIEPHLRMLKRQADRAQKGTEISQNLKEKHTRLLAWLWKNFQEEREIFSREKDDLGIRMMNVQREADKISDELKKESADTASNVQADEREVKRSKINTAINQAEKELLICEARIEIEKDKLAQKQIIQSLPVDLAYVKEKLTDIQKDQDLLMEKMEAVQSLEELAELKIMAKKIRQRIEALRTDAGKGQVEIQDAGAEAAKKESAEKIAGLEKKKSELEVELDKQRSVLEEITQEIAAAVLAERKAREHFFELERNLYQKQDELNKLKDHFNEAKIKLAKVEVREEDLTSEIRQELRKEPNELEWDGQAVEREALEKEVNRLKFQLEQIGGIDPLVVKEYAETEERFNFLTKESADLEMEQKIDKVFASAFEEINTEFTKYLRIIFGGGNAHLSKSKVESLKSKVQDDSIEKEIINRTEGSEGVDNSSEEDEKKIEKKGREEVGVEIFACPPGKRISNLSMLSGGERSLTSLALLFAIIAYNPPPFAVLDEVEAALDEANSRRFGKIITELSDNTQFVMITHNRETMRQANLLYGVTMGEEGISKLLSVRLDQVGQGGKIIDKSKS
jgi:chromosome segregation ATPase